MSDILGVQKSTNRIETPWKHLAGILSGALIALVTLTIPAAAEPAPSIAVWEQRLDRAGASSDYAMAAEIVTGPVIKAATEGIGETVAKWLSDKFGASGFRADTISVLSTAEKGERRLFALYHENNYAFLFVVFHKRGEEWVVLNFSLETTYPSIRKRF